MKSNTTAKTKTTPETQARGPKKQEQFSTAEQQEDNGHREHRKTKS
jgi:hypothetical protein